MSPECGVSLREGRVDGKRSDRRTTGVGEHGNLEAAAEFQRWNNDVQKQMPGERTDDRMRLASGIHGQGDLVVQVQDRFLDIGSGGARCPGQVIEMHFLLGVDIKQFGQGLCLDGVDRVRGVEDLVEGFCTLAEEFEDLDAIAPCPD